MKPHTVEGSVHPSFTGVREAFAGLADDNAALAIEIDGERVVDLWTAPKWRRHSLVHLFSVTKPLAALCVLRLVDRGVILLDEPVTTYWPEYGAAGKAATTVRQVLANQAGLVAFAAPQPTAILYDWQRCIAAIETEAAAWPPGERHGESALLYGHLAGELIRRTDGRTLGAFFREEIAAPHGLDIHIGVRGGDLGRVVDVEDEHGAWKAELLAGAPDLRRRALDNPPGLLDPGVLNGQAWREAEIPAVNGHSGAAALARLYGTLADPATSTAIISEPLLAEAIRVHADGMDAVFDMPAAYGLGFRLDGGPFKLAEFGYGGIGGSVAYGNRSRKLGLAFVTGTLRGPERAVAMEEALMKLL